jgi:hypothetical protein
LAEETEAQCQQLKGPIAEGDQLLMGKIRFLPKAMQVELPTNSPQANPRRFEPTGSSRKDG